MGTVTVSKVAMWVLSIINGRYVVNISVTNVVIPGLLLPINGIRGCATGLSIYFITFGITLCCMLKAFGIVLGQTFCQIWYWDLHYF